MAPDRRPTGDQVLIVPQAKNGNGMWKWATGTIVAVALTVGAGVVAIKTDLATALSDIKWIKDTIAIERGMTERHDGEIRVLQKDQALLDANCKSHTHRRR